ncbi:mandelate racemase/muconate lactonizing enzyme family protein [Maribellus luteus]|nr:mandelate racemase/muconate lactonizing enzyme family protein [Maribellus luteus]
MLCLLGMCNIVPGSCSSQSPGKIYIADTASAVEKEPLLQPFGFKGGYLSELWQTAARLSGSGNNKVVGLGTQSVLWSDQKVFLNHSETEGNAMMYAITQRALEILKGQYYTNPVELLESIMDELLAYGKKVTGNPHLRKTFVLNALVAVDNALWLLYAKENGITGFDQMIPAEYRPTFSEKHQKIAAIPLISYGTTPEQLKQTVDEGYFFMKIKIGQPGSQEEMLQKDTERLSALHEMLKDVRTPHTQSGKLPYYFDANGRYETKETFLRFLDHAQKIGAFEQIAIIEEPFPEEHETDVSDIPVRLAADESAHTDVDTEKRIEMGYRAVALKPIAKTLSMTMKIAKAATDRDVPCFCADLTVNPVLVEWNRNIAARLKPFPGLQNLGLLESNGHQNYRNWEKMMGYLPDRNKPWVNVSKGLFTTGEEFFKDGGGIFQPSEHYNELFAN